MVTPRGKCCVLRRKGGATHRSLLAWHNLVRLAAREQHIRHALHAVLARLFDYLVVYARLWIDPASCRLFATVRAARARWKGGAMATRALTYCKSEAKLAARF